LVARGTLDDVLWRLIEKKFRDLGEFVEGKERLKLVVETVFESNADLMSSIFDSPVDTGNDEGQDFDDGNNSMTDFNLSLDDIAELGEEERKMLSVDGEEAVLAREAARGEGQTESSAISLLDDDDMDKKPAAQGESQMVGYDADNTGNETLSIQRKSGSITATQGGQSMSENSILWGCRLFKVIFTTPVLGLSIRLYHNRVIIYNIQPERRLALGDDCKPAIGDILVSIGGYPLPLHDDLEYLLAFMKFFLKSPPVELQFIEAPRLAFEFLNAMRQITTLISQTSSAAQSNQVIELLDD
jgi:hypothetical protein